jgi:hypothetical protein
MSDSWNNQFQNKDEIPKIRFKDIIKIIEYEQNLLIRRGEKVNKIPKDIAKNRPLRENLLSLFICIYSKTPLFICGKPGSSKTISVNIIKDIFRTKEFHSEEDDKILNCFNLFQPIRLVYYQGSVQSTDIGIERVFIDTIKKLKNEQEIPLVFFDEIGLAELSPYNPLKVLHKYLEYSTDDYKQQKEMERLKNMIDGDQNSMESIEESDNNNKNDDENEEQKISEVMIPFVGISNWTIDVSKMNRNIYLSRPTPEKEDLKETAEAIITHEMSNFKNNKDKIWEKLKERAEFIAQIYWEFRQKQNESFPHKNFHSLRDFYWLLKCIGKQIKDDNINRNREFLEIIMKSIFTNFSGYFYYSKDENRKITSYESKIFITYFNK